MMSGDPGPVPVDPAPIEPVPEVDPTPTPAPSEPPEVEPDPDAPNPEAPNPDASSNPEARTNSVPPPKPNPSGPNPSGPQAQSGPQPQSAPPPRVIESEVDDPCGCHTIIYSDGMKALDPCVPHGLEGAAEALNQAGQLAMQLANVGPVLQQFAQMLTHASRAIGATAGRLQQQMASVQVAKAEAAVRASEKRRR